MKSFFDRTGTRERFRIFLSRFLHIRLIREVLDRREKPAMWRSNGRIPSVKRFVASGSMRRIKEQVLGYSRCSIVNSNGDIWLLGVCYKVLQEDSSNGDPIKY
ncbi:hypothetical protein Dimus_033762 [Dionaea muscipula]